MSNAEETQIPLKLLIDKVRNKVVFAESDYSFVDILFSFMTLPLGTIVRLIKKNSDSSSIGCLNSLYEGIANLPPQYFSGDKCKLLLLNPRNSSEFLCSQLKLNMDDTKYFICENWQCSRQVNSFAEFSIFNTEKCSSCGKMLNREIGLRDPNVEPCGGVFVTETVRFMITDNLCVMPSLPSSCIRVLGDHGISDKRLLEERNVNIGLQEVLKLLELALFSRSPLTDLFLCKSSNNDEHPVMSKPLYLPSLNNTECSSVTSMRMDVRVFMQKSNGKLLFLQAEESFVDFLFCFLFIPLGKVVGLLSGNTSVRCIDELYRSIIELNASRYINPANSEGLLLNPQVSWHYLYVFRNEIFKVPQLSYPRYIFCRSYSLDDNQLTGYLDSSSSCSDYEEKCYALTFKGQQSFGDIVRKRAMFMVTNDLVVTPSLSALSFLDKLIVPLYDVEERAVRIGVDEGLRILKASLTSTSALSYGINLPGLEESKERKTIAS